jgi:bacterial leucyl aminopeptidase
VLRDLPLLPAHVSGERGSIVYAVPTATVAARLDVPGFWMDRLGPEDEPLITDLYLLPDDRQVRAGFLSAHGNSAAFFAAGPPAFGVLASTAKGSSSRCRRARRWRACTSAIPGTVTTSSSCRHRR